jgi:hypothetical protein
MIKETKVPVPAWAAGWDFSVSVGQQGQRIALEAAQIAVVRFPGDDVLRAEWSERRGDPPGEWKFDHVKLNIAAEYMGATNPAGSVWLLTVSGEREGLASALSARVAHDAAPGAVNRVLRRLAIAVGNSLEAAARAAVPAQSPRPVAP